MTYFAKFEPDEGGFLVTFTDVPEAITGGKDRAEALANAQDALEVALLT
jgi:antitoxin HicB